MLVKQTAVQGTLKFNEYADCKKQKLYEQIVDFIFTIKNII